MSEEPSVVPSIGGVFLRPMPMLLGDCEEQEEEDTRRPRRVSASVNLGDFTRIILRTYEVTKLRSYEVTKLRSYEVTKLRSYEVTKEEE